MKVWGLGCLSPQSMGPGIWELCRDDRVRVWGLGFRVYGLGFKGVPAEGLYGRSDSENLAWCCNVAIDVSHGGSVIEFRLCSNSPFSRAI